MKIDNSMSQSERCELFGVLIDTVEDWLEEKGIKPYDIPNPEREDEDSAIIYGSDYDYLADSFSNILGIARDADKAKSVTPIEEDVNKLVLYANHNDNFEEDFGEVFYNCFMEEDNQISDIVEKISSVFSNCKTADEMNVANDMLTAITGYSLQTLLTQYEKETGDKELNL